jgi:hypothetical protein
MANGAGIICPDCSTTGVSSPKDRLAWSLGTGAKCQGTEAEASENYLRELQGKMQPLKMGAVVN